MVRVATPIETATTIALIPSDRSRRLLRRYLGWRGQDGGEACLVLVGHGRAGQARAGRGGRGRAARARPTRHRGALAGHGLGPPAAAARRTCATRCGPQGYAVDTVETAIDWGRLPALAEALGPALRHGLEGDGERVHAYSHLSHLYPSGSSLYVTYAFRLAADPDETLDRWTRLKTLASETIVAHGGTISHQHGVGRVHAPYLAAEKGAARDGHPGRARRALRPTRRPRPRRAPRGRSGMSDGERIVSHRRRHAERAGPAGRPRRHDPWRGPGAHRGRTSRPSPGWAEQDPGRPLVGHRRGLPAAPGRDRRRRPRPWRRRPSPPSAARSS